MAIISRLVSRDWFKFFAASSLVLLLLLSVANLIAGFLRTNVTAHEVLINHLIELPGSLKLIFPIGCLFATIFSVNKLQGRNELAAIFSIGYPRYRFVLDIVSAGAIVAIILFFVTSFLQPYIKSKRHILIEDSETKFRNLKGQGLRTSTIGSGKIWYKSGNYFFAFSAYDRFSNSITDASLYFFDQNYQITKRIIANRIVYKSENTWTAQQTTTLENLNGGGFPVVTQNSNIDIQLNETDADFKEIEADITTLNIIALFGYIKRLTNSGINVSEYLIMLLDNISSSLVCIVFSLIAIFPIFNPNRRGSSVAKSVIAAFAFTLLYWLINSYMLELGRSSKLNAYLATFMVPILFSGLIGYIFFKHRRLR
jgi:lipopolysaccharide export system permease protein